MKKILALVLSLALLVSSGSPAMARSRYWTFKVVDVNEQVIVLERNIDGTIDYTSIKRSQRPDLKVGDRIRYNPYSNKVGVKVPPAE